jgi:ABC-type multidrug transport system ATPase subunit
MFKADELWHRIAVINNGKIVAMDTPQEAQGVGEGHRGHRGLGLRHRR